MCAEGFEIRCTFDSQISLNSLFMLAVLGPSMAIRLSVNATHCTPELAFHLRINQDLEV